MVGGYNSSATDSDGAYNALKSMYSYNIGTDTWTRLADMIPQNSYNNSSYPQYRYQNMLSAAGNYLFVYGGINSNNQYFSSGLMYDITNNSWSQTPALDSGGRAMSAAGVYNGGIYFVNGYGSNTNSYNNIECIPRPRRTTYQTFYV
jgi:N-acetylneuraminic acid mutarotase